MHNDTTNCGRVGLMELEVLRLRAFIVNEFILKLLNIGNFNWIQRTMVFLVISCVFSGMAHKNGTLLCYRFLLK